MPVRLLLAAACALLLALPAAALAQGAGDDQYSDPFGSQTATPTPAPRPVTPSAPAAPSAAAAPTSATASTASTAATATPTAAAAASAPAAAAQQLPRTGADVRLAALAGALLLGAGVALRLRLRD